VDVKRVASAAERTIVKNVGAVVDSTCAVVLGRGSGDFLSVNDAVHLVADLSA
jgi:hypothetical protein